MRSTPQRGAGNAYQGMNWIRKEKRLAIYLRDGLACVWCGASVEEGTKLTLDHLKCHVNGGGTDATNLVTACLRCNSSRGCRPVKRFAAAIAEYLNHGVTATIVLARIREAVRRPLDVKSAKALIERRGGFQAAVKGGRS